MVQIIQAQNINLAYLEENFQLHKSDSEDFFPEWLQNLPEINDLEKQFLDRVKANFLHLIVQPPFLENAVKMVVLSFLLDLAGFYPSPPLSISLSPPLPISNYVSTSHLPRLSLYNTR